MTINPAGNPNPTTAAFRSYEPGPHAGVDTDPDSRTAPSAIDPRARNALILGVLSLLFGVLTGIPAIWLGRRALVRLDDAAGEARGRRAAWAGIALGCLSIVSTVGLWLYLHTH